MYLFHRPLTPVNSDLPLGVFLHPYLPALEPQRLMLPPCGLPARGLQEQPPTHLPLMLHPTTRGRHTQVLQLTLLRQLQLRFLVENVLPLG